MAVEVTNVSPHGFWLLIAGQEKFVSFQVFPWFRDASIADLAAVDLPSPHHLRWPRLDIDLAVESIDHPERFPLIARSRPTRRGRARTPAAVEESPAKYRVRGAPRRKTRPKS